MKMTLVRKVFEKDRTLGELHLEGIGYFCDTLEPHCIDWSKEKKVAGIAFQYHLQNLRLLVSEALIFAVFKHK